MIRILQTIYHDEPNFIEFHGRERHTYMMNFDSACCLPTELLIEVGYRGFENYIEFSGADTPKLINAIVNNANKETCKMLIRNLQNRLDELNNE